MPALVHYILSRLCIGFALGALSAVAVLQLEPPAFGASPGPLEALLVIYGIGSAFALGYLATALGWENMEV
ncbi:hypothetical protein KYK30_04955 [Shinella yambaruensis]|uniref:MFS transporter n=1 Tax=Shinella yambaruensis TaxID=415996 RepID=A0ABQ5ZN56_9HYPH|nr:MULTISPECIES: hypothetical protein [Shinella]CAI0337868.1 conserved hypothetical protein [Rhizobiaceae bacterium]CAK7256340.1 MFS transporter [Shinella sp. WSC3-e]MCJ8023824.1 hypothetical protein [Shinella yambaruensis]MCO5138273.1 hypothetical protein [Shinella sp.]MCU7979026.1 hypothetical protein [Shinella yambaruensis]